MRSSKHLLNNGQGNTYVYAFWLSDVEALHDGLDLLRPDEHPDWFCAGAEVDTVLAAGVRPHDVVSPNVVDIYDDRLISKPLLGAMCLGSASAIYAIEDARVGTEHWWCAPSDLTWRGRLLLHELNRLYGRQAVLLTYLEFTPIRQLVPEAARGQATVAAAVSGR